jgi:hypothetical protein
VAEAEETNAAIPPKVTLLLAVVDENPLPEITTLVPIGPDSGAKEIIEGACPNIFPEFNRNTIKKMYLVQILLKLLLH